MKSNPFCRGSNLLTKIDSDSAYKQGSSKSWPGILECHLHTSVPLYGKYWGVPLFRFARAALLSAVALCSAHAAPAQQIIGNPDSSQSLAPALHVSLTDLLRD
jgi:hypothetical protein